MRTARFRFNLLLASILGALGLGIGPGPLPFAPAATAIAAPAAATNAPASTKGKKAKKPKPLKFIRVHVEARHDLPERSLTAQIGKDSTRMKINVEKLPILNETHVEAVALLEQIGGFQIRIKFNSIGAKILESYTAAAVGRHLAIVIDVDEEAKWIALPLIRTRIGDGVLAFSPDASREIADRLVTGLNAEVERNRRQWLQ